MERQAAWRSRPRKATKNTAALRSRCGAAAAGLMAEVGKWLGQNARARAGSFTHTPG
jgi:hypothetical protein